LLPDGGTAKVGRFCTMFGTSGPDGLAMDEAGNLYVAQASLAHVLVFAPNGEWMARIKSCRGRRSRTSRLVVRGAASCSSQNR
jgi:gluconolactonase